MKVLIISHLPAATQNNMGKTFLSLFSRFDRAELCQLYIYPAVPDVDRLASYYRVTDKEVLSSLLGRGTPGGEVDRSLIRPDQGLYENAGDESFYRQPRNKSALRRLLRDAMWAMSGWYSGELRRWLDRENPTCVFVAPGVAKFVYDMALRIAGDRGLPIVSYVCDEYYFVKEPDSALDRLRLKLLKKKIDALMAKSARLVVICDELKQAYQAHFGIETHTLMTGSSYPAAPAPRLCAAPERISYFGNIRCNRYRSLAQVGRTLDEINAERGTGYGLDIYTSEKDPGILETFRGIRAVKLRGFVTGEAFDRAFHDSQLLLHVEAFDDDSIDRVRHSVSTKIADSLASGIPLLAYGPACVASMGHLARNGCALTATAPAELKAMLLRAFTDADARQAAARRGLETAAACHDSGGTGQRLRQIIGEIG